MFLQREVAALRASGVSLRLYSLWGGGGTFRGIEVRTFPKWRLLELVWRIPAESWRRPAVTAELVRGLARRRAPSWINFWENMLGAGFACIFARSFRRDPPALLHAAWSGAPATAAWLMWRLADLPFSAGAHAYDIFEHGGDWWLREKLAPARFVHTSSHLARAGLIARGVDEGKVFVIRSGLDRLPSMQKLRACRVPLRLLCVSRLVEKKGLDRQINIYAALRKAGLEFHARIVGNGPLRAGLEKLAGRLGVADRIAFTGEVPFQEVWEHLSWADVLLHTGVVAPSGDQDGLPNVIGEAMGAGVVVITSPTAATTEAVTDGVNGLVRSPDEAETWVAALRRLAVDDRFCEALRAAGRRWVEENFNVDINTGKLLVHLRAAAGA